jgi:hypothetical protein
MRTGEKLFDDFPSIKIRNSEHTFSRFASTKRVTEMNRGTISLLPEKSRRKGSW